MRELPCEDDLPIMPQRDLQPRRTPGVAAIGFGVMTHLAMGLLLFTLPPGGSVVVWLAYVALGAVGLAQIIMGAMMYRNHPDLARMLDRFEPDDIPWHAKRCPACDADLGDAVAAGRRRCPSCGGHFTTRDLGWRQFDPAGEPVTLSPHEHRVGGPQLIVVLAMLALALIALAVYAGVTSPNVPGP